MKRFLAILLCLILTLSCLSGTAMAQGYKSKLLKKTINLPGKMALVGEEQLADGNGVEFTFSVKNQPNVTIYTDVQLIEDFKGYTMAKLPDEVLDSWTEYYYQYYPENASAGRLPSNDKKGDDLYCYCGQGKDGGSILVYMSLRDQICVSSYCISADEGMSKLAMQATLEALNAVNVTVAKTASGSSGGSKSAPVYSHNNYDVLIVFLLLEDDEDVDLYEDEDFDFDYDDWDEDLDEDLDDEDVDPDDEDLYDEDDDNDGDYDDGSYDDGSDYDDGGYDDSGYDDGGYEDYGGYDDGGDDW